MKKIILIVVVLLSAVSTWACDICGCGVGSYYLGILPEFNKKIFGIRYRHNFLRTHIGAGGSSSYLTTDENYHTAELWGGWTIGKRFRLMGYIPLNINEKFNQGVTTSRTGLGDVGLQGFYQVFDHRKTIGSKMLVQSLWLGAGVKLPTGKYDQAQKSTTGESANIFQLGTGSTDFTFNAMYDVRVQDAGINAAVSYKINTGNKYSYRYGNKLSSSLQAYYKFRIKNKMTIAPNTGISYETAAKDVDQKYTVDVSGGNILMYTAGAEASFKKISIGANWQTPLQQNLANGFVKAGNRLMVHVSFML